MVRKLKKPNTGTNRPAGNQQDIIRQAQVMQQEMLKIQEELKDKFVETSVAGGAITMKANGQKEIVDVNISLDILKDAVNEEDSSMISDLFLSAINEVMAKAEEMAEKEMEVVTGGVNIPGLF